MLLSIISYTFANSLIVYLTNNHDFSITIEPHEVTVCSLFGAGSLTWFIKEDSIKCVEDEHLIVINGSDYLQN